MILKVYSIHDAIAGTYSQPLFARSDEDFFRNVQFSLANTKTVMSAFPQHYDAYRIAEFDDDAGVFVPLDRELVFNLGSLPKLEVE